MGIEMMRGADIRIGHQVKVTCQTNSPLKTSSSSSNARVDVQAANKIESVDVEMPADVKLYIDPRCPDTIAWFEDMFCRQGRQGIGIRLDVGGQLSLESFIKDRH